MIKVPANSLSGEDSLPGLQMAAFSPLPPPTPPWPFHEGKGGRGEGAGRGREVEEEGETELFVVLSYKDTNPGRSGSHPYNLI